MTFAAVVAVSTLAIAAASVPAAQLAANGKVSILVFDVGGANPTVVPNGATRTVRGLNFGTGAVVETEGPEDAAFKIRFELSPGLEWGVDGPDPSESCTSGQSAECTTPTLSTAPGGRNGADWMWDVVAARAGSYTITVQIIQSSTADPNAADDSSSITVVVPEPAGTGAAVVASAVRLSPAKPKAGSVVTATVRVSAGGAPVKPIGLKCTGTVGGRKLSGTPRAAAGIAACRYRPSKGAKGKTLRGTIAFTARGTKVTRRFRATLR